MRTEIYQKLKPIIDECYQVFGKYPIPKPPLNICYDCCVSAEIAKNLVTLPLKDLTQVDLAEYNSSVKDDVETPEEIKYFLPRMIELFVQGEKLHHFLESTAYFERVGNCPKDSFSPKEQTVWQKFADAYLDELLKVYCWQYKDTFGEYVGIFSSLEMFYTAHVDIEPFLQRWRNTATPQAVIDYVNESYWYWCSFDAHNISNNEISNTEQIIINWLFDMDNRRYFTEKIINLDKKLIERFYAWNEQYVMVEHLFDLMTYDLKN